MPKLEFKIDGLDEVRLTLEQLTPELVNEVEAMQRAVAERARATIYAGYPMREGNLRGGLRTRRLLKGRVVAATVIENTWWLASVYDHGSKTIRHTKQGWSRGKMPQRPIFTQTTNDAQREARARTAEILRRHGLTVFYAAA